MTVEILYQANNTLGEGPLWHPTEKKLYWVDIEEKAVFSMNVATGALKTMRVPERPAALAAHAKGGVFVALAQGLAYLNPLTGETTAGAMPYAGRTDVRFNDGKCDRQGRFWVGSLDLNEERPIGELIRFDDFHTGSVQDQGFTVSNGLGWSPDDKHFYFTDSPARTIYHYDYDIRSGGIKNRRVFATLSPEEGYPDGLCVDSEGYLWVCHWDGWKITRFAPSGEVDRVIAMPVQRPTCCAFGGPEYSQLYVTSARRDLSEVDLAASPAAGAVFVIETGVKGLAETPASFDI